MSVPEKTILVFSMKLTHRLRYIFRLMLRDLLEWEVSFTTEIEEYNAHAGPKLNYSNKNLEGGLAVMPATLLFAIGFEEQEPAVAVIDDLHCLYPTHSRSGIPFDPFAASFFMVSRYEEYLPHISDTHSRFEAKDTLAFRSGFLRKPVVNLWAERVRKAMIGLYPELPPQKRKYHFINTIDVDNAYAFKEKGVMRTLGGFGRALMRFDFKSVSERFRVLYGSATDPYDTYEYMLAIQKKHKLDTIVFWLLADYGHNDKNVPVTSRRFQSLIKSVADYAKVGIHPSYGSNTQHEKLAVEIGRLAEITRREITRSRQHFLKLTMPDTYRRLVELGITDDHTMGFASEIGFRAGICTPYYHYDLDQEQPTLLRVHPFAVMDGTLNEYMQITPDEAKTAVKELIDEVKAVNGTFIHLWHNETLNDRGKWAGWRSVYESIIEEAISTTPVSEKGAS
jgi:hypothetical protein